MSIIDMMTFVAVAAAFVSPMELFRTRIQAAEGSEGFSGKYHHYIMSFSPVLTFVY